MARVCKFMHSDPERHCCWLAACPGPGKECYCLLPWMRCASLHMGSTAPHAGMGRANSHAPDPGDDAGSQQHPLPGPGNTNSQALVLARGAVSLSCDWGMRVCALQPWETLLHRVWGAQSPWSRLGRGLVVSDKVWPADVTMSATPMFEASRHPWSCPS